jgi:purine-binding chemotaxis protein CheW
MIQVTIQNNSTTDYANELDDANASRSFLCFFLCGQQYAIDLIDIREVKPMPGPEQLTRVAHAPSYVKGVANLRGNIVPIIDLKLRFGLFNESEQSLLIVTEIEGKRVAIAVDEVKEVTRVLNTQIQSIPRTAMALDVKYLNGMINTIEGMVLILNIGFLLKPEELHETVNLL